MTELYPALHLEGLVSPGQAGAARLDILGRVHHQSCPDLLARDVSVQVRDFSDRRDVPLKHSVVLDVREVQRPAVLREVRRVTDQAMIPGQVIRHRHDSAGVLERVPRQILSPWMRQNQHRRRGRLRQHIHMLAKAVRPLPDSAMQMTISHHKIRPGLLHRI